MCSPKVAAWVKKRRVRRAMQEVTKLQGLTAKKVIEYDQELPQSHNADQSAEQSGRATEH